MEQNQNYHISNRFQTVLERGNLRKPSLIYTKNAEASVVECVDRQYTSKDVLLNITKQLDALQNADDTKKLNLKNNLIRYKNFKLMPVNLFSLDNKQSECSHSCINQFETQCISDTQLINIVEDAEKVVPPKGLTQEFENTFCEQHIKIEKEIGTKTFLDISINNDNECFSETNIYNKKLKDVILGESNKTKQEQIESDVDEVQSEIILSPIINIIKPLSLKNSLSPLTYTLDAFENFETLAFPIVETNLDLEAAKHLINSQIIDKELYLGGIKSIINKEERSPSPVLRIKQKRYSFNSPKSAIDKIENVSDKLLYEKNPQTIDMKIGKYFEDEILFSSDEEDSKKADHQDLPLTCALETSFYNQHNILEKTMYVGFQTASNKSIQISTESFSRAQSALEDLDCEVFKPTLTELVVMYDKKISNLQTNLNTSKPRTDNTLELSISNDQSKKDSCRKTMIKSQEFDTMIKPIKETITIKKSSMACEVKQEDVVDTKMEIKESLGINNEDQFSNKLRKIENYPPNENYVPVFHTASNKRIRLSENALEKCQQVFRDIDLDDECDETLPKDIEINEQLQNLPFIQSKHKIRTTSNNFNIPILPNTIKKHNCPNEISEQIQLDDQNIIKEFENDLIDSDIEITKGGVANLKNKENNNQPKCEYTTDTVNKKSCLSDYSDNFINQPFLGFKTASNKNIDISECALMKTKFILNDFNLSQNSKNNLDIDKALGQDMVENNRQNEVETQIGLTKQSDNNFVLDKIHSSNSLHKDGFSESFKLFPPCHLKTESNKPVTKSSQALAASKMFTEDIETPFSNNPMVFGNEIDYGINKNTEFHGFKTASYKPVVVSTSPLSKMNMDIITGDDDGNQNLSIENEKDNLYSDIKEILLTSKNEDQKAPHKINLQTFEGFRTASNKNVKISSEALAKSKKLFQDLEFHKEIEQVEIQNMPIKEFKGFQTANNKRITVSSESVAKSKLLFQDLNLEDNNENEVLRKKETALFDPIENARTHEENIYCKLESFQEDVFVGFQTASNKQVKVSDQALALSKKILQDLELEDINKRNETNKRTINEERLSEGFNKGIKDCRNANILNHNLLFKTGNNKDVNVTHEALMESKIVLNRNKNYKVFKAPQIVLEQMEMDGDDKIIEDKAIVGSNMGISNYCNANNVNYNLLFKTGNNMDVRVTQEALIKSKKILDLNRNDDITTSSHIAPEQMETNTDDEINVETLFDSEVLNNLQVTMYTEDFQKDTKSDKCKRSGSPILLCPRAKKRKKFEVPCKTAPILVHKRSSKTISQQNITPAYSFDDNYKKTKKYILKDLKNMENLDHNENVVDRYLENFSYDTSLRFEFDKERNEFSDDKWTVEDLKKYFISLVTNKLIPDGWLDNHLRLIIFKLVTYEKEFKNTMLGICSAKNVLKQLKYRYDKELYNVERPALRKLLEKDDISTKTMILRVIEIYADGTRMTSEMSTSNVELLLTDGWYCIQACLDKMLVKLVREKKITVGTKLAIHGAEMMNCDQGMAPWEDTSQVRLKIFGNSTRRARWYVRLGFFPAGAILTPLSRVQLDGGKVSKLRTFVTRVYPTVYVEKFDDGSTVTRSERLEHLYQIKYESERHALLEKIYEEVEKEFTDQESQDSDCDTQIRGGLDSGSQINRLMRQSKDPSEFRAHLSNSQCRLLQDYSSRRREKLLQIVQARIEERLKAKGLHIGRNVVPVMKIRLADVSDNGDISKAMMSIWRPNDAVQEIIKEGMWINIFNIVPTAIRLSEIQFSAGRQTIFSRSGYKESSNIQHIISRLKRTCYSIRDLVQNPTMTTDCNEVDTAGLIFLIDPSIARFESVKGQLFQNVYLADGEKNIVCVNFWGGLKKFGYENILDTGQVLVCMNLQKRAGNTRKSIPQFRVTEFTYFTKTPKIENVRKVVDDLNRTFMRVNVKKFCEECISKKNSYSVLKYSNGENMSPYRINYNDYNISRNKSYIHSPVTGKANNLDDILNLSGLDFESTFKQTDTQDMSPSAILRKKKVNEKIARLKMYGEPPPITPIHIINKCNNAKSAFKNPLSSNINNNFNVGDVKEQQSFSTQHNPSPVVRSKNTTKRNIWDPVKLNFSNNISKEDCSESKVNDPFAEEFDASPPLSLD